MSPNCVYMSFVPRQSCFSKRCRCVGVMTQVMKYLAGESRRMNIVSDLLRYGKALQMHMFVEKVLRRLFPKVPHGQEKGAPMTLASEIPPEKVAPETVTGWSAPPLTDGDAKTQPGRRLYTVSLPPEGYVPTPPEPHSCTESENSTSSDGTGVWLDLKYELFIENLVCHTLEKEE
nr:PREDICTED: glutamate-rich protein 1-like [Equus przewalskii]